MYTEWKTPDHWLNAFNRILLCSFPGPTRLLRATRGARNLNLQAVIKHASHVRSQDSFGLPLRMNGMHRTQFDHSWLDLLSLVIWSGRVFWPTITWNLRKAKRRSKSVINFDLQSLSPALCNLLLLLVDCHSNTVKYKMNV